MKKEDIANMIRLVEEDLTRQAKGKRGRDYFDGVRQMANLIVANISHLEEDNESINCL